MINADFGPQLEISFSVNSLFMVKDSYQCLKDFYDFGPQQEISYEFSVDSLFALKEPYQCLTDFLILYPNRKTSKVLTVCLCLKILINV